jgi:hypothetical protein
VWVDGRSTVDGAGDGFALVVTHDEDGWRKVADDTQRLLGVPLAVQRLEGADRWQGAALVRPDGVVAWRSSDTSATPGLHAVLAGILGRAAGD